MARTKNTKTASKAKSSSKTGKRRGRPPAAPEPTGLPRPVWAAIYGGLGILTLLSMLPLDGFLLRMVNHFFSGFLGSGFFVLPFVLLGAAALLLLRPKGPVRLRLTCMLLIPVDIGCLAHTMLAGDWGMPDVIVLWDTGVSHGSGGILSGTLAAALIAAISAVGTGILLVALLLVLAMVAFHITPAALWKLFKTPEYTYDDEEEAEKYENAPNPMMEKATEMRAKAARKRRQIDIPLDSEPPQVFDVEKPENALHTSEPEETPSAKETLKSLEELVRSATAPSGKAEEPEKLTPEETAKLAREMDESQKAPAPEYIHPSLALLKKGKKGSGYRCGGRAAGQFRPAYRHPAKL